MSKEDKKNMDDAAINGKIADALDSANKSSINLDNTSSFDGSSTNINNLEKNEKGLKTSKIKKVHDLVKKPKLSKKQLELKKEVHEEALKLLPKLDPDDANSIYQFGATTQNNITEISRGINNAMRVGDSTQLDSDLVSLMKIFRNQDKKAPKGILGHIFRRTKDTIYDAKVRHQKVGATIDDLVSRLDAERGKLSANNKRMFGMYKAALDGARKLMPYIEAGDITMRRMQEETLPHLKQLAQSGDPEAQNNYQKALFNYHAVSRRTNNLRLMRQGNFDLAGKVNMIDIANKAIIDKVAQTTNLMAPLIQGNTGAEIMMEQSQSTAKVLNDVIKFANKSVESSSKKIGTLVTSAYKDQEKGILSVNTLNKSADAIISAIQSCRQTADEGEKQRAETTKEIKNIAKKLQTVLNEAGNSIDEDNKHNTGLLGEKYGF